MVCRQDDAHRFSQTHPNQKKKNVKKNSGALVTLVNKLLTAILHHITTTIKVCMEVPLEFQYVSEYNQNEAW